MGCSRAARSQCSGGSLEHVAGGDVEEQAHVCRGLGEQGRGRGCNQLVTWPGACGSRGVRVIDSEPPMGQMRAEAVMSELGFEG